MVSSKIGEGGRRWIILGLVYICTLAFAITMQSIPPILSLLMAEFQLSHAQGGLLMSFFALPGIIISIPVGMLADRYNQKVIGLVSLILMIIGSALFASSNSLFMLGLGRVISGVGAITLLIVAPQMLTHWFANHKIGIAMGVFNTGVPLGTILSFNFLSLLAENLGWRVSIWLSAGLSLVALILFAWLFTPAPSSERKSSLSSESLSQSVRSSGIRIWLVGITWMLFNAAMISVFTFTPDLLNAAGFSLASAGFLTSLVMWPGLVLSPAIGFIIDRIGHKRTIIAAGGIALAIFLPLIPSAIGWVLILMLLIGIAQAMIPAPIFALPSEIVSPERLGLAFGILSVCLSLGMIAGPAAAGFLKDIVGSYQASYSLASGFALLIPVIMILLKPHNTSQS